MKNVTLFLFFLFMVTACSEYPGYRRLTPGIYYSLVEFGDADEKPLAGDYITINIEYRTITDSVFFSGIRKIRTVKPSDNFSVDHCFLSMCRGDSASFILPASKFFTKTIKKELPGFIKEEEDMKINIRLLEIQSEDDFRAEKNFFLKWYAELSGSENYLLRQYLEGENPGAELKPEGFYMLTLVPGKDRKTEKGDHIWVHYEGKFLNGKFFDGTYRSMDPLDFIYGTQYVLIPGLEQALAYMSEGEKAMIILPSELAFGEKGDASGIIPPYTSIIYTLEIIKIE